MFTPNAFSQELKIIAEGVPHTNETTNYQDRPNAVTGNRRPILSAPTLYGRLIIYMVDLAISGNSRNDGRGTLNCKGITLMSSKKPSTLPSERLEGLRLEGNKYTSKWIVKQKVTRLPNSSGGQFSVGYSVVNENGTQGFLKATDIGFVHFQPNGTALDKLNQVITEQSFERAILSICNGSNMDRIVHALDFGEIETTFDGIRDTVFFIIFEKATGDVRSQAIRSGRQDFSWILNALHNLSVAVQQLHRAEISHNDIKPSNLLVFDEYLQKLADLGRATSNTTIGPWDDLPFCGDSTYMAPEFWYSRNFPNVGGKISFEVRKSSDLYLLGSMAYFFVTGEALTPILRARLRPEHSETNWSGSFEDVLPYLRAALASSIIYFDNELPVDNTGELLPEAGRLRSAVLQLCDPDPDNRGHPINLSGNASRYSVERYVSLFDLLAKSFRVRWNTT